MPGKRSAPRCVRGIEWPPRRARRDRSSSNLSMSQSTPGPDSTHKTLATSGFLAPPLSVSAMKIVGVFHTLRFLGLGLGAVDATGGLGGIATAKRALIQEKALSTMLNDGVRGGETGKASPYHNS